MGGMNRALVRSFFAGILLAVSFGAAAALPNFDELEQKLKIRPDQKGQFDVAVGSTKRALFMVGMGAMQLKDRLTQELMKDRPDFSALAREQDAVIEQSKPLFRIAGEEWKKLYTLLDEEQVRIAKSYLKENLGRYF